MAVNLENDWQEILKDEFKKEYYLKLREFLIKEYNNTEIYPKKENIFNSLKLTSFSDTKVVILGQDPYHGENQAHGLSFSVTPKVKIPPSLKNIYKELKDDLGYEIPNNGFLENWSKQGVLLLNTVLTVRKGEAYSHKGKGWETLTDAIIEKLNQREDPIVFILWGNGAISKEKIITNPRHLIIKSVHPSPLSARRGFFGSKPFSKTNEFLKSLGKETINWRIDNI